MKRARGLFEEVCALETLHLAYLKARKGKLDRSEVAEFTFHLDQELVRLRDELSAETYVPGPYRQFVVVESKKRLISAAPFRDRVVHHAVCHVIEPIFERSFIYDSYACRVGKGQHKAVERFRKFLRSNRYVLKGDVRRYFPSIDHEILRSLLARKIGDKRLLGLMETIIAHSPCLWSATTPSLHAMTESSHFTSDDPMWFPGDDLLTPLERRRGLPIGNQTSQFFANAMLDPLDHFVKEGIRERYYLRYCDDWVVCGNDKGHLHEVKAAIRTFLEGLRLRLHTDKPQVFPADQGTDFLGYRVFPTHMRVRKANVHRFKRQLRRMQEAYERGEMTWEEVTASVRSWLAHAAHADSYRLRRALMGQAIFVRGG